MNLPTLLRLALVLLLPLALALGCNTGSSHSGGNSPHPIGSTVDPDKIEAVAFYSELVTAPVPPVFATSTATGFGNTQTFMFTSPVWVFVDNDHLADATLWADDSMTGGQFQDLGLPPNPPPLGQFLQKGIYFEIPGILLNPVLLQVRGVLNGKEVKSNIIEAVPQVNFPTIAINTPAHTSYDPQAAPVVQAPEQASWEEINNQGHSPSYMLFLLQADFFVQNLEWNWIVKPVAQWQRYRWGDAAPFIFRSGSKPLLDNRRYAIILVGFDRTGWNRSTSYQRWFHTDP